MARHKDGIPLSVEPSEHDSKLIWVTHNLRSAVASGRLKLAIAYRAIGILHLNGVSVAAS